MRLDPTMLRYLSDRDFRVLMSVEMGMRNHELVPTVLIERIAGVRRGGSYKSLMNLLKHKLVHRESKSYEGYKLTYLGYDFLSLRAMSRRGTVVSVGRKIGVGKESDVYVVGVDTTVVDEHGGAEKEEIEEEEKEEEKEDVEGEEEEENDETELTGDQVLADLDRNNARRSNDGDGSINSQGFEDGPENDGIIQGCLKLHRLGRTSFRTVKKNRDYLKGRKTTSWLYLSRLAALKEYAFMKVLYENGFNVPKPLDVSRHGVLMELIDGTSLNQIRELGHPGSVFGEIMSMMVRLGRYGLVHCDFNEFNILLKSDESVVLIDFPQMVSTEHENAEHLFNRDIECVKLFFERRYGFVADEIPSFQRDVLGESRLADLDNDVAASGFSKKQAHDFSSAVNEMELELCDNADGEGGGGVEEEEEEEEEEGEDEEEEKVDGKHVDNAINSNERVEEGEEAEEEGEVEVDMDMDSIKQRVKKERKGRISVKVRSTARVERKKKGKQAVKNDIW